MSALGLLNALSPKDRGSHRLAGDIAYGPAPRQALDIYAPRRPGAGLRPVVVFFYGGAWDSGDRREYEFAGRALAALGYVVVIPDHRIVPAIEYPVFLEDLALAVDWVARHITTYGGDAGQMAFVGHSAGAYNATMLALDPQYLGASVMGRVRAVAGLSGPYNFFPFTDRISRRVFGAVADGGVTQPVNWVAATSPAMLLVHGCKDKLVEPQNTRALAARLRGEGVAVVEKYYPNARHAMMVLALGMPLRWRLPVLRDIRRFLEAKFSDASTDKAA